MIVLEDYFEPVSNYLLTDLPENSFGKSIAVHTEKSTIITNDIQIAIFVINENRDYDFKSCPNCFSNQLRKYLYSLYYHTPTIKIADYGNFKLGNKINDTLCGLKEIIIYLYECNITPIIIGGSQNITYGIYNAFDYIKKFVSIVSIDSTVKIGDNDNNNNSFITKILASGSKFLFNFSNIGFQTYFQCPKSIELMNNLYFDYYRIGLFKNNIRNIEPILRDAEIINLSVNAIKCTEFEFSSFNSPNGFSGDEVCQIAKYSGLSDKVYSFGIYDIINSNSENNASFQLIAQMIWYFIEGFSQKIIEMPSDDNPNYKKYIVNINEDYSLSFYRSIRTERWWIEVPYQKIKDRNIMISCSYDDYLLACNHEIPNKWLHVYQKIN